VVLPVPLLFLQPIAAQWWRLHSHPHNQLLLLLLLLPPHGCHLTAASVAAAAATM
jgi:hypothetical protein